MLNRQGSIDSNLSAYGYDMVVATTQDSINATLKQYLYKLEGNEITIAYKMVDNGTAIPDIVETDYDELIKEIGGIDLFKIPADSNEQTPAQKKAINDAYNLGLYCAIKGEMGINNLLNANSLPDIVTLLKSDSSSSANVIYRAFFNTLDLICLSRPFQTVYLTNYKQPDNNPWIFDFNVKLDLKDNSFKALPQDIQKQILNLDPETMFSIQQLYLDLNSAHLQSIPEIENIDSSSDAYSLLEKFFVNKYWNALSKDDNNDVIFGYTIKPVDNYNTTDYIVVPTDFNFYISTYTDPSTKENIPGLNTLNYLVVSDDNEMPDINPFTWNWIESTETLDKQGVISIKRKNFIDRINSQLPAAMKELLLEPIVHFKKNGTNFTLDLDIKQSKDSFDSVNTTESGSEVLTYKFKRHAYDEDVFGLLKKGSASLDYNLNSSVKFSGNKIGITTNISLPVTIDPGAITKHSSGIAASYTLIDTYELLVNEYGELIFEYSNDDKQNSGSIDFNGWTNLWYPHAQVTAENLFSKLEVQINSYKAEYDKAMITALTKSCNWVFPGNSGFVYKNVGFSDYQDLIVDVIYTQEN